MTTISIQEIQQDLLGFLRRVEAGQAMVIVSGDQPVAEIKPVTSHEPAKRPFG